MDSESDALPEQPAELGPGLGVDLEDPEAARAHGAIEARLLGISLTPQRIGRFVVLERLGAGGMGIVYAAFDPQLDRRVAIKLLFSRGDMPAEHARLAAEAKAMARLAHPNVVHVYEVGEHRGQLFVAMEHVRGRTLRKWWTEAPRTVREVLAVCIQAGEGLAAAHAAGIVHRDFKPDNVLVGEDPRGPHAIGRARVLDFGLARTLERPSLPELGESGDDASAHAVGTTSTGTRVGTPGYIAPEQLRGESADRDSDQFSFCVTVWEALVGVGPFAGNAAAGPLDAIAYGRIHTPPRARMPAWVERVLRRGLADEQHVAHRGRHASVEQLLRELSRDPVAVRRRRLGIAAVAAGVVGAFMIGNAARSSAGDEDPCAGAEASIDGAWPTAKRAAALAGIAEHGGVYGAAAAPRLVAAGDAFVASWISGHRDACLAHQRGEQSEELLDRRMMCLSHDRSAFGALGRIAGSVATDDLTTAFGALPDPQRCADLTSLTAIDEPPPLEALPLTERLAEVEVLYSAGEIDDAITAATKLVEDARTLGYRPLLGEALYVHALMWSERGDRQRAAGELLEATELGLRVGDDVLALRAWGSGAWAVATSGGSIDAAMFEGRDLMVAIAERHPTSRAAMSLYIHLGGIELAAARRAEARTAYGHALEIGTQLEGNPRRLAAATQGLAMATDDPVERERLFAAAVAATTEAYGAEHPRTLAARSIHAANVGDVRRSLALLQPTCAERRALHPSEHRLIAECEWQAAMLAELTGDEPLATAATDHWAAAALPDDVALAKASALLRHGDAAAAAALLEPEVRELESKRDPDGPFYTFIVLARSEVVLGRAWRKLGDQRADAMLAQALADIERAARESPMPAVLHVAAYVRYVIGGK